MVEQTLPEGEQFYLFLSCLFGMVAKFCSSILGYQLHHFPYRLNVVSAFVQMLFTLLLWRETEKKQMWLKDMCKTTPVILCDYETTTADRLSSLVEFRGVDKSFHFAIVFPCVH